MPLQQELQVLDAKLFRAFLAAAEAENFTSAAKLTYMTQSGISQHISRLEEQAGVVLFKRVGKRVVLTEAGKKMQHFIREYTSSTELFLDSLREGNDTMAGRVSYAMPASCLLAPQFSLMLDKRRRYPDVQLEVTLAPTPDVLSMVLDDKVDFGFVAGRSDHPSLQFEPFCQEEYVLVSARHDQLAGINGENIFMQPCVVYPGVEIYFGRWLKHHFPKRANLEFLDIASTGKSSSVEGAIKMVEGGLGISVFPRHCVAQQLKRKRLFEYISSKEPLVNDVYVTYLAEHSYPRVVRQVIDWFLEKSRH